MKLAPYRHHEKRAAVEDLLYSCHGAGGSYVAKQQALAAWDALPEATRADLLEREPQRRAVRYESRRTYDAEDMRDWLRGPVLLDPFGLKAAARRRGEGEEGHRRVLAMARALRGRERGEARDRSHLRLVK